MIRRTEPLAVDMLLFCPSCGKQHIDAPEDIVTDASRLACHREESHYRVYKPWGNPPHRSHLCHGCGHIWRPSDTHTNGVLTIRSKGVTDSPFRSPTHSLQDFTMSAPTSSESAGFIVVAVGSAKGSGWPTAVISPILRTADACNGVERVLRELDPFVTFRRVEVPL